MTDTSRNLCKAFAQIMIKALDSEIGNQLADFFGTIIAIDNDGDIQSPETLTNEQYQEIAKTPLSTSIQQAECAKEITLENGKNVCVYTQNDQHGSPVFHMIIASSAQEIREITQKQRKKLEEIAKPLRQAVLQAPR